MRSVFIYTTIVIVVSSVFSQRPLPRYSENLKKAVPQHWHHDQENPDRRLDQISRRHKVEPHEPPLRLHQTVPWLRWVHEGRWAAQADKNTELHKIRTQLLKEKLKPNHLIFKPHVNPQLRPNLKRKVKMRTKREAKQTEPEKVLKITETQGNIRKKRDLMMTPELLPEMIMQPHIQAQMPNPRGDFSGRIKETEIQDKKQILDFINKLPQLFARSPRTTMNPFIRDTHIEDYDIIRPDAGEREGMIPTIESGYSDLESHPLVTFQNVLSDLIKKPLNMEIFTAAQNQDQILKLGLTKHQLRVKRSPKMSKLKKKQKLEKKKRKQKKKKKPSPRQIKHYRRIREKKEKRKMLHAKKLKEKQRLRHKKLGTGPYNKTITDYYGIYFDPPSIQLNESLYDSIYDTSEIDSDALYEERMREKMEDYPESESEESEEYEDAEYEDIAEATNKEGDGDKEREDNESNNDQEDKRNNTKSSKTSQLHQTQSTIPPHVLRDNAEKYTKTNSVEKESSQH